jgi:hypothetical protein
LWELASFRNFYKSLHTQGINVFRAPLSSNHLTLQHDAESGHGPRSGGSARSKEFVLLVSGGGWAQDSRQQLLHHVPFDVCQAEIAAE